MTRINDSHIGWYEVESGQDYDVECILTSSVDVCIKHGLIPAFVPLATPIESTETRADMEACAEVVKASYSRGDDIYAPGDSEHTHKRTGSSNSAGSSDWRIGRDVVNGYGTEVADDVTEADAVLWVVEGKLPGGES